MIKTSEKAIKKELIKIITKHRVDEVIYEPRYVNGYQLSNSGLVGATITIRTTYKK
jgi:hypothetical protein